jgi:hypothetical protein
MREENEESSPSIVTAPKPVETRPMHGLTKYIVRIKDTTKPCVTLDAQHDGGEIRHSLGSSHVLNHHTNRATAANETHRSMEPRGRGSHLALAARVVALR